MCTTKKKINKNNNNNNAKWNERILLWTATPLRLTELPRFLREDLKETPRISNGDSYQFDFCWDMGEPSWSGAQKNRTRKNRCVRIIDRLALVCRNTEDSISGRALALQEFASHDNNNSDSNRENLGTALVLNGTQPSGLQSIVDRLQSLNERI